MNHSLLITSLASLLAALALGCAGTSNEAQRAALGHQQSSDEAARDGEYGRAGDEQRKAQDSHHKAVTRAIDEGKPIPPQTKMGDTPPPPTPQP